MKKLSLLKQSLLWALLSSVLLAGCSTSISRVDLQKMLLESPSPLIIDVRSAGEYDTDHIPGALHIPFYNIGTGLGDRAIPKEKPVVLYCEHGPRAGLAGISLYLHGYGKVYSLNGHMKGWRTDELPLAKGSDSR
jgi:rhodanese-related sulfurtransferase